MVKSELISVLKNNRSVLKIASLKRYPRAKFVVDNVEYKSLSEFGNAILKMNDDDIKVFVGTETESYNLENGILPTGLDLISVYVNKPLKITQSSDDLMQSYYKKNGTVGEY